MPSTNVFSELCVKITARIYSEKNLTGLCNPVYVLLCIRLIHVTPPVTAEGFDGSHHSRYIPNEEVRCRYGIGRVVTNGILWQKYASIDDVTIF